MIRKGEEGLFLLFLPLPWLERETDEKRLKKKNTWKRIQHSGWITEEGGETAIHREKRRDLQQFGGGSLKEGWKVDSWMKGGFFIFREIDIFGKGTIDQPHHSLYTFSMHKKIWKNRRILKKNKGDDIWTDRW